MKLFYPMKAKDIEDKFSIDRRRIQYFIQAHLVGYKHNPGRGPTGRTFFADNILEILLAEELSKNWDLPISRINLIFKYIQHKFAYLLKIGTHEKDGGSHILIINDGAQFCYSKELDGKIKDVYACFVADGDTVEVDLSIASTAMLINISNIYRRMVKVLKE